MKREGFCSLWGIQNPRLIDWSKVKIFNCNCISMEQEKQKKKHHFINIFFLLVFIYLF